ncbi:MAG: hypothetical protein K2O14_11200 [Oscillospiraceae bacterium]|nr:hypothetical protein [Oscillospiraceae bacterium]
MKKSLLNKMALFCRMLALYPFAALTDAAGFGKYIWWHYLVFFAMTAVFYTVGYLAEKIIVSAHFPKAVRPIAVFISRAAVLLPTAAFIILASVLDLSAMVYMYALPAGIIAYFSGYRAYGQEYSDLFSVGWFGLFFTASVVTCLILNFSRVPELYSAAVVQLCLVFGLMIVFASLLANQTNIDQRTRQRSAGKSVLPNGLRSYNAMLIAGISVATVALFLLAKPLATLIVKGIGAFLGLMLSLIRDHGLEMDYYDGPGGENQVGQLAEPSDNAAFAILWALVVILGLIAVIRFRRQIINFFKELFAPLFRESRRDPPQPFADEITDTLSKSDSARSRRRSEQQLLRQFRRETDPRTKFRLGYKLFMVKLERSAFAPLPSDTTSIHAQKGQSAFRREDIREMVGVYNKVRYGEAIPSPEQLEKQQELIEEIR